MYKKKRLRFYCVAVSKSDHSSYDCFACAILTHGGNGDILYARDEKMKVTDFTRPFCADVCGTLAGKPKLFFIQVGFLNIRCVISQVFLIVAPCLTNVCVK